MDRLNKRAFSADSTTLKRRISGNQSNNRNGKNVASRLLSTIRNFFHKSIAGKIIATILMILYPIYVAFTTEFINQKSSEKLMVFLQNRFPLFIADILLMAVLGSILLLGFRRAWIAFALQSALLFTIATINHYKVQFVGDPLFPWDIGLVGHLGSIIGLVDNQLHIETYIATAFISIFVILIVFFLIDVRVKIKFYFSLPIAAILCGTIFFTLTSETVRFKYMPKLGLDIAYTTEQEYNYMINGLIGGFSLNVGNIYIKKPSGYSSSSVSALMSQYDNSPAGDGYVQPDIIVILSEAFWNPENIPNTQINTDPFENFKRAANEGVSGTMICPTYGGGTIRTEFEILTGMSIYNLPSGCIPYQQYIHKSTPSLVSYLKGLGYNTVGLHTFYGFFYDRNKVFPLLGFDEYIHMDIMDEPLERRGNLVSDAEFVRQMKKVLDDERTEPLFLFGISMENHGSYSDKFEEHYLTVSNSLLDNFNLNILANFAEGVYDADKALGDLIEYAKNRSRPTVIMYFGDHLPSMGGGFSTYVQSGMLSSPVDWTNGELKSVYSTEYFIWSNYKQMTKTINNVAPYILPSMLLDYIEAPKTPFWNFLSEYQKSVSVLHKNIYIDVDGKVSNNITKDVTSLESSYWMLIFDRLFGKQYSALSSS